MNIPDILRALIKDKKLSEIVFDDLEITKKKLLDLADSLEDKQLEFIEFKDYKKESAIDIDSELFIYTDGAVSGNPGEGGIGAVIFDSNKNEIAAENKNIGYTTNNIAEYKALLLGLSIIEEQKAFNKRIHFLLDSELVVKQIKGEYKINNNDLRILYLQFLERVKKFKNFDIKHITRDKNKIADELAVFGKLKKFIKRRIK